MKISVNIVGYEEGRKMKAVRGDNWTFNKTVPIPNSEYAEIHLQFEDGTILITEIPYSEFRNKVVPHFPPIEKK
jgi:hypothetical protein